MQISTSAIQASCQRRLILSLRLPVVLLLLQSPHDNSGEYKHSILVWLKTADVSKGMVVVCVDEGLESTSRDGSAVLAYTRTEIASSLISCKASLRPLFLTIIALLYQLYYS